MKTIDLHTHSTYSDGSCSVEELFSLAVNAGLSAFALTDHDTLDGYFPLLKVANKHNEGLPEEERIEVLPGVEISAGYKDGDIHILGLLVDPNDAPFRHLLKTAERERDGRNKKMAENLKMAGLPVTYEKIVKASPDSIITRAHFGKFLVDKGIVSSYQEAFETYLGDNTPYYVPRKFTTPKDAIQGILKAGGVPVLAHPILYRLPAKELTDLVRELVGYGLRGIETIYSTYSEKDEDFIRSLSKRFNLLITGGSDFHGAPKPNIKIGVGKGNLKIPYEILEKLREEQKKLSA